MSTTQVMYPDTTDDRSRSLFFQRWVKAPCVATRLTVYAALCLIGVHGVTQSQADEVDPDERPRTEKKVWTEEVKQSAERFKVYPTAEAEQPLQMLAAYKWRNAARPNVLGDRLCLLYVHAGRPVASCKVYPTGKAITHTFISITDQPLVGRQNETVVWSPPPSAPTFAKIPDANPPHASASGRRIQMKSLVRNFSGKTGPGEAKRQSSVPELRLLPQPLYRYEIQDHGQDGPIDGGVFLFVANGGNPQVLLLIEAVREGDAQYWQYGFSRRTLARLVAFHKEKEVWRVPHVAARNMKSTGGFHKIDLPTTE